MQPLGPMQANGSLAAGPPVRPVEHVDDVDALDRGPVWDHDHEMFHPERDEVGHYYRIEELRVGRRYRRGDTARP